MAGISAVVNLSRLLPQRASRSGVRPRVESLTC
jgi:hypothetical protein